VRLEPLDGSPLEERAVFFRRQADANGELDTWEIAAEVFDHALADLAPLSAEQKREVWTLALAAARTSPSELLARCRGCTVPGLSAERVLTLLREVWARRNDPFESPSRDVRADLASALGKRKDGGTLPGLARLLNDRSRWVQNAAAVELGRLGDPSAVGPLIEAFERTPDWRLRGTIARAVGELGHSSDALKARVYVFDPINLVLSWMDDYPAYSNVDVDWYTLAENLRRQGTGAADRLADVLRERLGAEPSRMAPALQAATLVPLTPKLEAALHQVAATPRPVPVPGTRQLDVDNSHEEHSRLVATARAALAAARKRVARLEEDEDPRRALEREKEDAERQLSLFALVHAGQQAACGDLTAAEGQAALERFLTETGGMAGAPAAAGVARWPYSPADPWYYLGLIREKLGRLPEAKECYESALERDPKSAALAAALKRVSR
jgi:HEAT repeat protein